MSHSNPFIRFLLAAILALSAMAVQAAPPPGKGKVKTLKPVRDRVWDENHVRRVLKVFAWGGHQTDSQVAAWAAMAPEQAAAEMLSFNASNDLLSPPDEMSPVNCGSLESLQAEWSAEGTQNPMTYNDRKRYATLNHRNQQLSTRNLQETWVKAISTRGCNPVLHKMTLFLTNYHASIHVRNTRAGLMRAYYDDYAAALMNGDNFIEVMTVGAKHAAVARAYGHEDNRIRNDVFYGNEDFAREYLQLFFGILGTTEDNEYYETVSIKNNAQLLTGMKLHRVTDAYGSVKSYEWWVSPIIFADHNDPYSGRLIRNLTYHQADCLEVLHEIICGATAAEKLDQLGPVAGNHPESLANVPVNLVAFFADDNLDSKKIEAIRGSWSLSGFDLLSFIREYAISQEFHDQDTFKYFTAFDRNLILQNATTIDNEENFAKPSFLSPYNRMNAQGMKMFEPIRNVFGHQTGLDAMNSPFIFKDAFRQNARYPGYFTTSTGQYWLQDGGDALLWVKDWGSVIPESASGFHEVDDVAEWLWNHVIGDGGRNFDIIARAQVQSLLATGDDFAYSVNRNDRDPAVFYSSADIGGGHAAAAQTFADQAAETMDFSTKTDNERVGMAVNFISMTPYAFAMEGQ